MGAGRFKSGSRWAAVACLALSVLAILLWGKLKLVTGAPRTAFAEPGAKVPAWRRAHGGQPAQERQAR